MSARRCGECLQSPSGGCWLTHKHWESSQLSQQPHPYLWDRLCLSPSSMRHTLPKTPSISFSPAEQLFRAYSPAIIRVSSQCTILGLFFTSRHNGERNETVYFLSMFCFVFLFFFSSQSIHSLIVLGKAGEAEVTCHHGDGSFYFMPEQFC